MDGDMRDIVEGLLNEHYAHKGMFPKRIVMGVCSYSKLVQECRVRGVKGTPMKVGELITSYRGVPIELNTRVHMHSVKLHGSKSSNNTTFRWS